MKGESHVLGIPIPKTLVIWAFPSHTTLAIWVRVKVKVYTGNAHITRVLGMGMPKTRGCPYHWDTASFPFPSFLPSYFHVRAFSPRSLLSQSLERHPKNTRPDLLPTNTRYFDFLSPDRSPNNPRWRQSRNQSRCMHRCLQSSIITTASRLENLSSSYGGNENASCTWRYWGVVGNNYGRDVTSGSQTPEENGLI